MLRNNNWKIIPWWAQIVVLIYLFLCSLALFAVVLSILGFSFPVSIYGLAASSQFSVKGMTILLLFITKGVVGYLFVIGNKHAPILGLSDSIVGILICLFNGFIYPYMKDTNSINLMFRLEILILAPLIVLFYKLNRRWKENLVIN